MSNQINVGVAKPLIRSGAEQVNTSFEINHVKWFVKATGVFLNLSLGEETLKEIYDWRFGVFAQNIGHVARNTPKNEELEDTLKDLMERTKKNARTQTDGEWNEDILSKLLVWQLEMFSKFSQNTLSGFLEKGTMNADNITSLKELVMYAVRIKETARKLYLVRDLQTKGLLKD